MVDECRSQVPCAHVQLFVHAWDPAKGARLLQQIGDIETVDLCPRLREYTSDISKCTSAGSIAETESQGCPWRHLIQFFIRYIDLDHPFLQCMVNAGYTGVHMDLNSVLWTLSTAVRSRDMPVAIFLMRWIGQRKPRLRDVEIHERLKTIVQRIDAREGDTFHTIGYMEFIHRLNSTTHDVFPMAMPSRIIQQLTWMECYVSTHIPLFRLIDARFSFLYFAIGKEMRVYLRREATRVLQIQETLSNLTKTHRGVWMIPDLVAMVTQYDSHVSEVALDGAQRTLYELDRVDKIVI
jgi:hypothetical protein